MHKKHSATHLRLILSDVLIVGLETLRELHRDLDTIKLDTTDAAEIDRGQRLISMMILVNNVIHPAHDVGLTMLPGGKLLIEKCMADHQMAIEKKYISGDCGCHECTLKKVLK